MVKSPKKVANKLLKPIILSSLLACAVLTILLATRIGVKKNGITSQLTPKPTNHQKVNVEERPITRLSAKEGWVTYKNDKFGYEVDVPTNSLLREENVNSPYYYTRIQNYSMTEDKTWGIDDKEYFLEINISEADPDDNFPQSCVDQIISPISISLSGGNGYKGKMMRGGGETAKLRYALCIKRNSLNIHIQASENVEHFASEIVNSFRFTK